jgi:hypothetical protein
MNAVLNLQSVATGIFWNNLTFQRKLTIFGVSRYIKTVLPLKKTNNICREKTR